LKVYEFNYTNLNQYQINICGKKPFHYQDFGIFKSKFIDVENKNEKLIDNIHKEFNFKKKEGGYS